MRWSASLKRPARAFGSSSSLRPPGEDARLLPQTGAIRTTSERLVRRTHMNDWLWTELHHHFDTDDGSLPEVHVNFVDKQAVVTAFAQLVAEARTVPIKARSSGRSRIQRTVHSSRFRMQLRWSCWGRPSQFISSSAISTLVGCDFPISASSCSPTRLRLTNRRPPQQSALCPWWTSLLPEQEFDAVG